MKKEKFLIFILIIFLAGDLTYSFLEYYYTPLDGDLTAGTVAGTDVKQILNDPFGFKMVAANESHINPNRYFSHLAQKEYMQNVPLLLQHFVNPITSVYLACALLKMGIHLLFLFGLSWLISGKGKSGILNFLLIAALLVPLIQVNGYWGHMGINDRATTYVFFYALPLVLLMVFFFPVYQITYHSQSAKLNLLSLLLLLALSIILPLSGPLVSGVVLIVCLLVVACYFPRTKKSFSWPEIPGQLFLLLIPIVVVSIYSLFLGQYDTNYRGHEIPIQERYFKLPAGIYYLITQSLGVPLLLLLTGVNAFLIKKHFKTAEGEKILHSLKWIGLFTLIYLLALPLGGYRPYRPNILRYDTFIPITIALIYFYGNSSFFLINRLKTKSLKYYGLFLLAIFAIYMNSDRIKTEKYQFERECLNTLANSPSEITKLPATYNVMSWEPLLSPERSENNATMLMHWNITKTKKLYYQSSE